MTWPTLISPGAPGRVQRKLLLAWLALLTERLWQALLWPLLLAGLMVLLIASGVLPALPALARLMAWAAFAVALAWLLHHGLRQLRLPTREEALARVEAHSGLHHQPLRTLQDTLATPADDAVAGALWQAHRQRIAARLSQLKAGWPRSDAPRRDPYALRFALALALVATLALQGQHFTTNLRASLQLPAVALPGTEPARLDAWIDPPPFARTPPLMLAVNGKVMHDESPVHTVQGATLVIRHAGRQAPRLALHALHEDGSPGALLEQLQLTAVTEGAWQARVKLQRPVQVRLLGGGVDVAWRIAVAADAPPSVSLTAPPATTASGALELRWRADDDHGVRAVHAEVALARPAAGMLRYEAPRVALRVAQPARQVQGRDLLKLMAHPWAGLPVRLTLVASDVGGQQGRSKAVPLTLPERTFRQPLARAVIEQRRALVLRPARRRQVAEVLAALLAWPAGLLPARESSVYLGLRQAVVALLQAGSDDEVKQVVALLWEVAVTIEDGDLADARRQLEAARKALQEALRNGAPEEEIARRVAELKQALNRFLQSLAQRQDARATPRPVPGARQRLIRPQDLARMMDDIERMARAGARDAAQRLLSQLDDILQNLHTAPMAAAPPSAEEKALGALQQLMREQQKLLDDTWREAQRHARERDGYRPGEQARSLQRRQQALADSLRELMQRLAPQQDGKDDGPQSRNGSTQRGRTADDEGLGRAGQAMREAARRLGQGQPGGAMRQQMEALQALRQGARQLARRIARQQGRRPGAAGMGSLLPQYDPLGRPLRGRFVDPGPQQRMVPDADAMQRARRILEDLRRRAEDATRPPVERNYIERLLRGLY